MCFVINPKNMKTATLLIATIVAVKCMPRPDGLGGPDLTVPTGDTNNSVQPDANVNNKGEVEVTETKTTQTETSNTDSQSNAETYEHTDPNGGGVSQSSQRNSTHSESEKQTDKESNSFKVGQDGGVMMSNDKSSTKERNEENTETGEQSFHQSSGNDPNHRHTYDSGSEYENSNRTHDRDHAKSHDQLQLSPAGATQTSHSESQTHEHESEQNASGSSFTRQEDYDRDNNNNVRHTGSSSQNNYDNKASESSSNSTSIQEESNSNNNDGDGSGGVNIAGDNTDTNNQNSEMGNAEVEGQKNGEIDQNNNNTEGEIGIQADQSNNSDTKTDDQGNQDSDLSLIKEDKTNEGESGIGISQNDQTNQDSNLNIVQDDRQTQDSSGGLNIEDGQSDQNGGTGSDINVNGDNGAGAASEDNTSGGGGAAAGVSNGESVDGDASAGIGPAFGIEEITHELDRDERVFGLNIKDRSVESTASPLDDARVKNDYLFSVAQKIHNSKIVSDGKGNADIEVPHQSSEEYHYANDFSHIDEPYRTLAQKFGTSPVSSHHANAQIIESRFGNLPFTFDFSPKFETIWNTGNTEKSQQLTFSNVFNKPNTQYEDAANLQLTPYEWELHARKKAELTKTAGNNDTKSFPGHVTKINKIDPYVKNVILSRNLDDILKTAKTSEEIHTAMKQITGENGRDIILPTFNDIQNEINKNIDTINISTEDEIKKIDRNIITIDKPEYEVPRSFNDEIKDISQVITNRVDLTNSNKFDADLFSRHVIEDNIDPGLNHIEESFDIVKKNTDAMISSSEKFYKSAYTNTEEISDVIPEDIQSKNYFKNTENSELDDDVAINSNYELSDKHFESTMKTDMTDMIEINTQSMHFIKSNTSQNFQDNLTFSSNINLTSNQNTNNTGNEYKNKRESENLDTENVETTNSETINNMDANTKTLDISESTTVKDKYITSDFDLKTKTTSDSSIEPIDLNKSDKNNVDNTYSIENSDVYSTEKSNNDKSFNDDLLQIVASNKTDNTNIEPKINDTNGKNDIKSNNSENIYTSSDVETINEQSTDSNNIISTEVLLSNDFTTAYPEILKSNDRDSNTLNDKISGNLETNLSELNSSDTSFAPNSAHNNTNLGNIDLDQNENENKDEIQYSHSKNPDENTKNDSITQNENQNDLLEDSSTIRPEANLETNQSLVTPNDIKALEITTEGTITTNKIIETNFENLEPAKNDDAGTNYYTSSKSNHTNATDSNTVIQTTELGTVGDLDKDTIITERNTSITSNENMETLNVELPSNTKTSEVAESFDTPKVEYDEKKTESNINLESDESKETVKRELHFDRSFEEKGDAGTDNIAPVTGSDSSSATFVDSNVKADGDGAVENNDKVDQVTVKSDTLINQKSLETIDESSKIQDGVQSDISEVNVKPETTLKPDDIVKLDTFIETEKFEREKEESKIEMEESTSKSEESRSSSMEPSIFSSLLTSAITDYSASASVEVR